MRISAKEDYAVRAVLELALADGGPVKREQISEAQEIPLAFLQNILMELRHAEIVEGSRAEFRRRALDLVAAGKPVREVALLLDVSDQSIYSWPRQDLRTSAHSPVPHSGGCQAQLASRHQMRVPVVEVILGDQPVVAEAPHLVDDREQGDAFLRQLVLDPRGRLGIALAQHHTMPLQRMQALRERAWADPGASVLELGEPAWALGEVMDDQRRPLRSD
jgi:Iron-dependent Transcriptional regulator